jgi:hypothetical protein
MKSWPARGKISLDSDRTPTIRELVERGGWSPGFQAVFDVELHP